MKEIIPAAPKSNREPEKMEWSKPFIKKIRTPETYYGDGVGQDGTWVGTSSPNSPQK